MRRLILASASPRRAELMRQIGAQFEVMISETEEKLDGDGSPAELVQRLALAKAEAVSGRVDQGMIIGADTVVVQGGHLFGKPADRAEAAEMLKALSGQAHSVLTGVAIIEQPSGAVQVAYAETRVFFKELLDEEITAYALSGEGLDKAGAYGIQGRGALLVEKIEGDYFNVVGMPLQLLNQMLDNWQINLLLDDTGTKL